MKNFLCDTNIVSEVMKKKPHSSVVEWFCGQNKLVLSVITVEEVFFGLQVASLDKKLDWFMDLLSNRGQILPVTMAISKRCAYLRSSLQKKGIIRTQADMLIAATALEHNLILVTRNEKDFTHCALTLLNPFSA